MAYSIEVIEEEILAHLEATMDPVEVIEQSIPDATTLKVDAQGQFAPFYAVQFGHIQRGKTYSFAGPRGDDYVLPIYTQSVSPDMKFARRMANRMTDTVLGMSFSWSGSVRVRAEGWAYPITSSSGSVESYQYPASFGLLVQVSREA